MLLNNLYFSLFLLSVAFISCSKKEGCTDAKAINFDSSAQINNGSCSYNLPTKTSLDIPSLFKAFLPPPIENPDNPLTVEGIALGKKLFYDPILSSNNTISCSSCHSPENSFSDNNRFSKGVNNKPGTRNAMPLYNLAWHDHGFFWDGRAKTLESQIFHPVVNKIEMNETWVNIVKKLNQTTDYPSLFLRAFQVPLTDSTFVSKAIAQFLRTLISGNSKLDRHLSNAEPLSIEENRGMQIFLSEKGDCFHCHGDPRNPLFMSKKYSNNGLDLTFKDKGRFKVTKNNNDLGAFKVPSLRNLSYTAPYMHDGRYKTLEQVINHYSDSISFTSAPTGNHNLINGGLKFTEQEKKDLKAFLLTFDDHTFINNKKFTP